MYEEFPGNVFFLLALIWLRASDDVGEELEEMRSEAEKQKRMPKVRVYQSTSIR